MKTIVITMDGKPIAVIEEGGSVDWYRIYSYVNGHDADIDEWRGYSSLDGKTISEFCEINKIKKWYWNRIANDFIEY